MTTLAAVGLSYQWPPEQSRPSHSKRSSSWSATRYFTGRTSPAMHRYASPSSMIESRFIHRAGRSAR